jgi:hypothetical protein
MQATGGRISTQPAEAFTIRPKWRGQRAIHETREDDALSMFGAHAPFARRCRRFTRARIH